MQKGKILDVEDGGTVWIIFYKAKTGAPNRVVFDWRQFAHFYEGTSGQSFFNDYSFGKGIDEIRKHFLGKTIRVEDYLEKELVCLED